MRTEVQILQDLVKKFGTNQEELMHSIFFNITNMCNLNCTNCSLNCGRRTPFYVDFEDFKKEALKLNSLMKIGGFILIGGEPLLHKDILKMCKFIKEEINPWRTTIVSNGLLTNKITDDELRLFKEYNVQFCITLYPKLKYIEIIENFEKRCQKFGIDFEIHGVRPCFGTYNFSPTPIHNKDDYFYMCEKSAVPHSFVVFDGRLYNCCLMPSFKDMGIPMNEEEDSLKITDIPNSNTVFTFANHSYHGCAYCQDHNPIGEPLHFWHTQDEVPSCDVFKTLYDYYLDDYDYYYKLCHTYGEIKDCLQNEYFLKKANHEDHLTSKPIYQYTKRFFNGLLDVYIVFNDINYKQIIALKPFLFHQTIADKCNFYFVSAGASRNVESEMYKTFPPMTGDVISTLFLKGKNDEDAYYTFIQNSYLDHILILNNNAQKCLYNNHFLEEQVQMEHYIDRATLIKDEKEFKCFQFEFPYNFDNNLISILKILDPQGVSIDCIYLPPYLQDYESILRGGDSAGLLGNMTREVYESHINYINSLFPEKIQLLLQKKDLIMPAQQIQYYINLGINKFCVNSLEQAKIIRELLPTADILGSIARHTTKEELLTHPEYELYFNGFVLDFSWGRKLAEIKTLPEKYRYVILCNAMCNVECDGDHHWYFQYQNKEWDKQQLTCPGLYGRDHYDWMKTTMIRPMDLKLWSPYISVFKIQDRGWPTNMIIRDYILYNHNYEIYPNITYSEDIYND